MDTFSNKGNHNGLTRMLFPGSMVPRNQENENQKDLPSQVWGLESRMMEKKMRK